MDEDREKGRIVSLTVRRQAMTAHARSMVEPMQQARREITGGLKRPVSLREYADWLNRNDHKTARGKVWRAQTVSRLFDIDNAIREQANAERKRSLAVISFKQRLLTPSDRLQRQSEHDAAIRAVEDAYAATIAEGADLKVALTG
jgi:hypothetical protein